MFSEYYLQEVFSNNTKQPEEKVDFKLNKDSFLTSYNDYMVSKTKGHLILPSSWSKFSVNKDLILNESISKLVKYDSKLNQNALIIDVNFFYTNLEKDLFCFMNSKSSITHLILNISSFKSFDVFTKKLEPLSPEDFEMRANRVIIVILKTIIQYFRKSLYFLSINFKCNNFNYLDYARVLKRVKAKEEAEFTGNSKNAGEYQRGGILRVLETPFILSSESLGLLRDVISNNPLTFLALRNVSLKCSPDLSHIIENSASLEVLVVDLWEDIDFFGLSNENNIEDKKLGVKFSVDNKEKEGVENESKAEEQEQGPEDKEGTDNKKSLSLSNIVNSASVDFDSLEDLILNESNKEKAKKERKIEELKSSIDVDNAQKKELIQEKMSKLFSKNETEKYISSTTQERKIGKKLFEDVKKINTIQIVK
eukprot:CAMPEP_0170526876 /NCGR_PEP_ID=MMETSP0209-20121228/12278_1 /TAXON_ID=665100 ORGANISM="Litonotus pictus, Strain P1" /NCGR_SAMPLE_ID=MMETSP0209 /ASSEMBLY_ACC=CAM_ASM_000301 /LENGTH=422 /DNA_ID=CAMNT_0010816967 /DNA_START=314 /DNA_END=1579 /DNA_ORIENTATION=-